MHANNRKKYEIELRKLRFVVLLEAIKKDYSHFLRPSYTLLYVFLYGFKTPLKLAIKARFYSQAGAPTMRVTNQRKCYRQLTSASLIKPCIIGRVVSTEHPGSSHYWRTHRTPYSMEIGSRLQPQMLTAVIKHTLVSLAG